MGAATPGRGGGVTTVTVFGELTELIRTAGLAVSVSHDGRPYKTVITPGPTRDGNYYVWSVSVEPAGGLPY
jgi:hypothetical protein